VLALLVGLAGGATGGIYADQAYPDQVPLLGTHHAGGHIDQQELDRALRVVQADYYGGQKVDYGALSHGTVRGMVSGLGDRFSYYLDPSEYQRQLNSYSGRYVGIGIEVNFTADYPSIVTVFADTPAAHAGLKAGDTIISVDGKDMHGMNADQSSNLIRGPQGTTVKLVVQRGSDKLQFTVQREPIAVPSVRSAALPGGVVYIRIYSFETSTGTDFDKQLRDGLAGASGVVLDLRDDGGGFIEDAQNVISQFVSSGEAYELRDRKGAVDRTMVSGNPPAPSLPVVVLVNGNTASASEMVAGSLRVHSRARLFGTVTYGKGSVQQDFPLPDGSDLHLTTKHWFLPDGSSVQDVGLQPDVEVRLPSPDAMFDVAHPDRGHSDDAQLNAALQALGR
jgi:carboxyl-terminal processing protease